MSLSLLRNLIPKKSKYPSSSQIHLEAARFGQLKKLAKLLKVPLGDGQLLNEAVTHKSYAHEMKMNPSYNNEKLEFLGDAVLGLVISQHVFAIRASRKAACPR